MRRDRNRKVAGALRLLTYIMIIHTHTYMHRLAGWLAGWQPIVYSKTAARLLKAAWCLLRIATSYTVLRRLTEVALRPAATDSMASYGSLRHVDVVA